MILSHQIFDEERALYGQHHITLTHCRFDGPADGESALKECADITAEHCYFNLRYPFWHDHGLSLKDCELTPNCRAALWYSDAITIRNSRLHGIKALRECSGITLSGCDIDSAEFGWFSRQIQMENCDLVSEYAMLRCQDLTLRDLRFRGKYSFQYIQNALLENCILDTKDAFWHARNVTVRNCTVKGEYLAWYSENITFENCTIIGTQPLCYCKGLRLIDCNMVDTDLCFERSEVEATILTPVTSIKNPYAGTITVPKVGQLIYDDPNANGVVHIS